MKTNAKNSNGKLSLDYLNEKFGHFNCKLCLLELPEKKIYRTHDEKSGVTSGCYCKGVFVAYDRSSSCFVAFLEDVYSGRNTGKQNTAKSYYMPCDRFASIWEQLISGKNPIITFNDFGNKDYIIFNWETFL